MFDIKKFRKWLNVTQIEMASAISIDRVKLSRLENSTKPPKKDILEIIKSVYEKEYAEFIEESRQQIVSAPSTSNGTDYKTKYFELLEQYKILSDKLTNYLESKIK